MPTTQQQGRNLEYAVRRKLRKLGYTVFRCAGSRPVDLIAITKHRILLVECKTGLNPHLTQKQMTRILDISKKVRAVVMLVIRRKYREMQWFHITEEGIKASSVEEVTSAHTDLKT